FFSLRCRPPRPTLFPYTTLFRSVVARGRVLDRLADRDPERTGGVRILFEDFLPGLRVGTRAGHDLGAPGLHHDPPVRLLLVRHLDHVDLALQPEHLAREREGRAPRAGP